MPSFLKDIRNKSRTSFRSNRSSDGTNGSNGSGTGNLHNNKSTSTFSSNLGSGSSASTIPSSKSSSDLKALAQSTNGTNGVNGVNGVNGTNGAPPVPRRPTANLNRYSISGSMLTATNGNAKAFASTSPLAPQVFSVSDGSWVHQKVLLIYGQAGDPNQKVRDGSITVFHHADSFPPTTWPVSDTHFKALLYMQPGPNRIRLDFFSSKSSGGSPAALQPHQSWININYLPLNDSPPLHLAILVAKDSPGTYDAVPDRKQREGNTLDVAIRKYRMAGYLWQAFTGEQMNRNGFGRRCFRYEEEWQEGTLTYHDKQTAQMRNEAKIHIIRLNKTVKEIQDLDIAQQYDKATRKGDLFGIAADAVKSYFQPKPGQKQYVSCMFLDSHWDKKVGTIRGHAALGGGVDLVQLAIFGSQALQSYPASIEEVVPAFSDCTRTDTNFVANDCDESGSNWEAANIGIGAHLHEVGHLFGCQHQESGVMLRDYTRLNRTFTTREPYSVRTKSPGMPVCLPSDECNWHRLDTLRFRFHPCFRLPSDPLLHPDESIQVWTTDNNNLMVCAPTGIAFIEVYVQGESESHTWLEYLDSPSGGCPRQLTLTESEIRGRLPENHKNRKVKLEIHSCGQGKTVIDDLGAMTSKAAMVKLPGGRKGYRGAKLGFSEMEGSQPQTIILDSFHIQTKLLTSIRVYHGFAVDGIEFIYEDGESQLFGKRGGKPGGSEFFLDTRKSEILLGFYLRDGLWIDGLQILTSLGRKSEIYGNPIGGSGHTLIPPRGYSIAGITGSCAQWLDGFQLIIAR